MDVRYGDYLYFCGYFSVGAMSKHGVCHTNTIGGNGASSYAVSSKGWTGGVAYEFRYVTIQVS
jgi:hypothetical protein